MTNPPSIAGYSRQLPYDPTHSLWRKCQSKTRRLDNGWRSPESLRRRLFFRRSDLRQLGKVRGPSYVNSLAQTRFLGDWVRLMA